MTSEPEAEQVLEDSMGPEGIGGWLILPAIGLVLGSIIGVLALLYSLTLFSDVKAAGYGGIYALELFVLAGIVALTIYVAIPFFRKRRDAPSKMILLLAVGVGGSLFLLVVELGASAEVFAEETAKQLLRDIVSAVIWIPYFRISKRVRATFVN